MEAEVVTQLVHPVSAPDIATPAAKVAFMDDAAIVRAGEEPL